MLKDRIVTPDPRRRGRACLISVRDGLAWPGYRGDAVAAGDGKRGQDLAPAVDLAVNALGAQAPDLL
jgi:hypothetical protein